MKKISFIALIGLLFVVAACNKETNTTYKVKFSVVGTEVTEFKISDGVSDNFISIPFTGTKDTTVYLQSVATLKVSAKGDGPSLIGTIFINDMPVMSGYDSDEDGDNKTEVAAEYTILKY